MASCTGCGARRHVRCVGNIAAFICDQCSIRELPFAEESNEEQNGEEPEEGEEAEEGNGAENRRMEIENGREQTRTAADGVDEEEQREEE